MTAKSDITQELLRQLIRFEADTGKYYWLPRPVEMFEATTTRSAEHHCNLWNSRFADTELFERDTSGDYPKARILGRLTKAHHVVWIYHYGEWPKQHIDHINHDRTDIRLENLRLVTRKENSRNTSMSRRNKTGVTGVSWRKTNNKWYAQINSGIKQRVNLGYYDNIEDAIKARRDAEIRYGYHQNHGR